MNFAEAMTEFYARGFDYLSQDDAGRTRATRWLNQAHQELCEAYPWSFTRLVLPGVVVPASVWVILPRAILSVVGETTLSTVPSADPQDLAERFGDLTATGPAQYSYLTLDAPTTYGTGATLTTYPVDTSQTFTVTYLFTLVDYAADASASLLPPPRYHDLVVDMAVLRAYKDSDNFDAYNALAAIVDRRVGEMAAALLTPGLDRPPAIQAVRGGEAWSTY